MAKAKSKGRTVQEDKNALQKKVRALLTKSENPKSDETLRGLRKRLKRAQRKIRGQAARISQAAGKKGKAA
jgi:hypothetical protein